MKTKLVMIFCALFLVAGISSVYADKKVKKNEAEVTYAVNMHGEHCKKIIEAHLPYEKGVTDMKVNLKNNTVWFKYDTKKTTAEKIKAAIEKLGYTAEQTKE
jgi:copper chaperone CopZ